MKETNQEKWDKRFLALARLVSTWSRDPSTKVGAVIVDGKGRVVSTGYNGFPRGVRDNDAVLADRDEKLRRTVHAEKNAILFAYRNLDGCTLYCTHPACSPCMAFVIQAGICRVVSPPPQEGFSQRWAEDMLSARAMAEEAGIEVEWLELGEEG